MFYFIIHHRPELMSSESVFSHFPQNNFMKPNNMFLLLKLLFYLFNKSEMWELSFPRFSFMPKIQSIKYQNLYIVPILDISTPAIIVKILVVFSLHQQYSKCTEYTQGLTWQNTWAFVFLFLLIFYNVYKILIYIIYFKKTW